VLSLVETIFSKAVRDGKKKSGSNFSKLLKRTFFVRFVMFTWKKNLCKTKEFAPYRSCLNMLINMGHGKNDTAININRSID